MINNSSSTSDGEFYEYKNIKIWLRREETKLTPDFGIKKTCFGILSMIRQTLTNVLLIDLSSFNNGVLPNRKSLPKKRRFLIRVNWIHSVVYSFELRERSFLAI